MLKNLNNGGTISFFPIMAASVAADMREIENQAVNLNNLGVEFADEGNFEDALSCFLEAQGLVPEDPTIRKNIQI